MTSKDKAKNNMNRSFAYDSFHSVENGYQYSNLNLNQNLKCSNISPVQSYSKTKKDEKIGEYKTELQQQNSTVIDNCEVNGKSQSWKVTSKGIKFSTDKEESEKRWKNDGTSDANKSTLSLHISAYENSVETTESDSFGESKGLKKETSKQILTDVSNVVIQNPFEFPRQQQDKLTEPEVSQFKASQRLLGSNEAPFNDSQVYVRQTSGKELDFVQTYNGLICHPNLIRKLQQIWHVPKPLARAVLPSGFEGRDMIIEAKDGSLKTSCLATLAAYMAHTDNPKTAAAVILTPKITDVFAIQSIIESLIDFPVLACPAIDLKPVITDCYPIIVGTPSRFLHLIKSKMVPMEDLKLLIVSKADVYSERLIQDDIKAILASANPSKTQYALFSNKKNSEKMLECFVEYMKEPVLIQLGIPEGQSDANTAMENLTQYSRTEMLHLRLYCSAEIEKYGAVIRTCGISEIRRTKLDTFKITPPNYPPAVLNIEKAIHLSPDLGARSRGQLPPRA